MGKDFKTQLDLVHRLGLQAAQQIEINLAVVVQDKEYNISGNFFYIFGAPDQTSEINVKINGSNNTAISWVKQTGFIHPFNRLYITTPAAQAGTMKILVAAEAPELFDVIDNRSAISQGVQDIVDQLEGDLVPETWGTQKTVGQFAAVQILAANAERKACIVQAKNSNMGIVYIGFDDTVTITKWVAELQASQAFPIDNYRGAVFAIADTAAQLVGYGEW